MNAIETTRSADSNAELRSARLVPTAKVWIVVLACVVGILVVRQMTNLDLAVVNIISFALLLIGFGTFLLWFCLMSDYPAWARLVPVVALVVAGSVFATCYEVVGVNGGLVPKIVRRGEQRHDEALAAEPLAESSSVSVDISETTPEDFPGFLGPNGDSAVRDIAINPDWVANPPAQEWVRDIGAGWSAFSVVNGFAFTMEQRGPDEMVTCYRVDDGSPCWAHSIETRHATIMGYLGPRSTPTVVDGRVYAMGATGILRCLDGATGDEIWIRDLFKDYGFDQEAAEKAVAWGRSASPLVRDSVVYIPVGGPAEGKQVALLAMDAETGETKWEAVGDQASYASPTIQAISGVDQLVMVNESNVAGYQIDVGEELWSFDWPGKSNMNATVSQPHVYDDDFLFLSKGYGVGAALVEIAMDSKGEWIVDPVWDARVMKTKFSNAAIHDGVAYGLDDGILCAVDVETGDRLWKKGRYGYGQILLVGDHLLVMGEDGALALVEASPDKYRELARIQALEGQSWNTICIYGDRILVRNSEQAASYRIKLGE